MKNLIPWLLCIASGLAAETIPLPARQGAWAPRVFNVSGIPEERAARFAFPKDPARGDCLAVGQWIAGRYGARFETTRRLPVLAGQVRGSYKTADVAPYTASVFVTFYAGETRLAMRTFELAPAASWTDFRIPIRRPPPGADSIVVGAGLSQKTGGTVTFADLSVTTEPFRMDFPPSPGNVKRTPAPRDLPRGDFYRVAEREGTWWLVSPAGNALYSTGTDGPRFEDMAEGRRYLAAMRRLGFNSLAGWTDVKSWGALNDAVAAAGERPLAAFSSLKTGAEGDFDRLVPGNHSFPDPYDPKWEAALRERVRAKAEAVRGKSWFAGFFADNEVDHRDLHRHVYTPHCSAALRAFLERKYGAIAQLNRAWNSKFASFDALIAARPDPEVREGAMYADFRLFKREIVRRYAETTARILREEAPGHLVFSNRFMLDDVAEWIDVIDLYKVFDGIGVNMYPANLSAGLNASEKGVLEMIHRITGKPIVVPEWSVPALDSGLYENPKKLDWSYREAVDTQEERARQVACVMVDFYNLPFVIGAHWFIWKDVDNATRQANRGLFKASGEPWARLQEAIAKTNRATAAVDPRPYGARAPWNVPVAGLPRHPRSDFYRDLLWQHAPRLPGDFKVSNSYYTYPVYYASDATREYPVVSKRGNLNGKTVPWNVAWDPAPGTDAQIIVLDPDTGREWNFWQVRLEGGVVRASNANLVPGSYWTREEGFAPSRGIGVPYLAMLIRPGEVREGLIPHAASMPVRITDGTTYVAPATKLEHPGRPAGIPEGMRFALNVTDREIKEWVGTLPPGVRPAARVIGKALRDYGWFITDTSGGATIQLEARVTAGDAWDGLGLGDFTAAGKTWPRDLLAGLMRRERIYAIVPSDQYPKQ